MPHDVGNTGHALFPIPKIGESLLLKLQFVGQVVQARRVVAAEPHERAVGLVGVHQDQQVLDLTRKPPLLRLVHPPPQVRRCGMRLVGRRQQPIEVILPVAPQHEVRLRHLTQFERVADVPQLLADRPVLDEDPPVGGSALPAGRLRGPVSSPAQV